MGFLAALGVEGLMAIGGLIVPPVFHFLKGMFLPDKADDPESTMSTLATTKPEVLSPYVAAMAQYTESQVKWFNRDVAGVPRQWIVDLRAALRPAAAGLAMIALIAEGLSGSTSYAFHLETGTRAFFVLALSSWFGGKVFNGSS